MGLNINQNDYAKKNHTALRNLNSRDVPKAASVDHHMPLPSSFLRRLLNGKNDVLVCMACGLAGMIPEQKRSSVMHLQQMCGNHFIHDMAWEKKPMSREAESINRKAIYLNMPDMASFDFAEGSSDLNSLIPRKASICNPAINVPHMVSNPAGRYSDARIPLQRKTTNIDSSNLIKYESKFIISGIISKIASYNSLPIDSSNYGQQIEALNQILTSCKTYVGSAKFKDSSSREAACLEAIREVSSVANAVRTELELVIRQSGGVDLSPKKKPVNLSIFPPRQKGHDPKSDLNGLISKIEKRRNVFISHNRGPQNHEPISSTSEESKGFASSSSSGNPDYPSLSLGVFAAIEKRRLKEIKKRLKTKSDAESLELNLQKSLANIKEKEWTKDELKQLDKALGVYDPILSGRAKAGKKSILPSDKLKIFRINFSLDDNMNLSRPACGCTLDTTNIFICDEAHAYKPGVDVVYYHELCHALLVPLLPNFEQNISYWARNTFCKNPAPDQCKEIKHKCDESKIELPVNDYGMTNPGEDMATTIELYLTDPEKLQKISSERFSFAENYVKPLLNLTSIKIKPSRYYRDPSEESCGCVII